MQNPPTSPYLWLLPRSGHPLLSSGSLFSPPTTHSLYSSWSDRNTPSFHLNSSLKILQWLPFVTGLGSPQMVETEFGIQDAD